MILQTQRASADPQHKELPGCQLGSLINAQLLCRWVVLPAAISSAMLMSSNTRLENQCWINVEWLLGSCRMRGRNPAPGDSIIWNLSQQAESLLHVAAVLPEHIHRREGRTHLCSSPLPTPSQDVSKSKLKSKQSHEKHFMELLKCNGLQMQ